MSGRDEGPLVATPWQTVGPFWSIGMDWAWGDGLAGETVGGAALPPEGRIRIEGRLFDGDGQPVEDGVLEVWQADAEGRYLQPEDRRNAPPAFVGFGRCGTGPGGTFAFTTVKPGRVPAPGGSLQAPHLLVSVFARGILSRVVTRLYFADDPTLAEDPILALVPEGRRPTLLAQPSGEGQGYRWDIRLQGEGETVFFRF